MHYMFNCFGSVCILFVLQFEDSIAVPPLVDRIEPGFEGSPIGWIDDGGMFLISNSTKFALGFSFVQVYGSYHLTVVHKSSSTVVWTANRGFVVGASDKFVFDTNGNVYLKKDGSVIWSTNTSGKGVSAMELWDSGNLVLLGNDTKPVWQSFNYPTDTLLSSQVFSDGMRLVSDPNDNNLTFYLELKSGDAILYGGFQSPQPYWSIAKEARKIFRSDGKVTSASMDSNSWTFFDQNRTVVWQFMVDDRFSSNFTGAAVLGSDGVMSFYNLQDDASVSAVSTKIPQDYCSTPGPCNPYHICSRGSRGSKTCNCLPALRTHPNCNPGIVASSCKTSNSSIELVNAGDKLEYAALGIIAPLRNFDLNGCKDTCLKNCSCVMMFFQPDSGNCFLFDQMGSMQQQIDEGASRFLSYIKVSRNGDNVLHAAGEKGSSRTRFLIVVYIVTPILFAVAGLLYFKFWHCRKIEDVKESFQDILAVDNFPSQNSLGEKFLQNLSKMPVHFRYKDLDIATSSFSIKLGQGGFGSVYKGILPDGTQIAVKKLEGVGQGKKEFQTEVTTMGRIHHIHLVRLRGFCAEGTCRLLAYDYMAKGSLDKWIFKNNGEGSTLSWEIRFNIALGIAKGLAYLHQNCCVKIVHCDIKPENVLLDDNYQAKVADFGLAKLMTWDQSRVVTTLRGTRGYLAPEWVTDRAISEKSDVYSFGMVLLEIIGGRRNFDPAENSEKAHFPAYVVKMIEQGKVKEIVDPRLNINADDERVGTAVNVALWCIQGDMSLRPSMGRVIRMLEGLCDTPLPPSFSHMGSNFFGNFIKPIKMGGLPGSDTNLSAVYLSGPR